MRKYLIPAVCALLSSCMVNTYPSPYYDVPPPQPTAFYSYSQPVQTPMTQTSLRHPFIPTTPAKKPLTPAYKGPYITPMPKKLAPASETQEKPKQQIIN